MKINDIFGPIFHSGLKQLSKRRLPQIDGKLKLTGLIDTIEIIRDNWGIPHIYSTNHWDLFFAQGFVHAQDRFWQMELARRTARGTLSEVFGAIALSTDRASRTFGFERIGRIDWDQADDQMRDTITAYTTGVNTFLNLPKSRLPMEFTLIRHTPQPWTELDTMSFLRLMAWQMSHAWYPTVVRAQLVERVGPELAAEWDIHYPSENPPTLPSGIEFHRLADDQSLIATDGPFLSQAQGSNAWVLTGTRTKTGQPILCNDTHLALRAPGTWYQNHLIGGDVHVTGTSLPGAPLVIIGHNEAIAWGITLAFTDCEDLFIEKFDPLHSTRYLYKDEWCKAEVVTETINIKGQTVPHTEKVLITKHGSVVSDVIGVEGERLALQSMSLQPSPVTRAFWQLNRAHDWDSFVQAMKLIEAPQLNVVYADQKGNIGYWLTGRTPIRGKGDGSVPVPGWSGEYDWVGEIPFAEMPHSLNPTTGYILTCNHKIIADDYPYYLGNAWMNGYRARRLEQIFTQKQMLTLSDFKEMQLDFICLPGQEFRNHYKDLPIKNLTPKAQLALSRLIMWDGNLTADSVGGALYEVTRTMMLRNLLEPILGKDFAKRVIGLGFNPVLSGSHEFYGYDTVNLLRMLAGGQSQWLQDAGGKEAVLQRSLHQAIAWLERELGPNLEEWQWGKLHRVIFRHALGVQAPLDRIFNCGPIPIGGDTDTVCQMAMLPEDPYDAKGWGPSVRHIIDLQDFSRSLTSVPPGQSGHIGSPHYSDQLHPWIQGSYQPMLWERKQILAQAEGVLTLAP